MRKVVPISSVLKEMKAGKVKFKKDSESFSRILEKLKKLSDQTGNPRVYSEHSGKEITKLFKSPQRDEFQIADVKEQEKAIEGEKRIWKDEEIVFEKEAVEGKNIGKSEIPETVSSKKTKLEVEELSKERTGENPKEHPIDGGRANFERAQKEKAKTIEIPGVREQDEESEKAVEKPRTADMGTSEVREDENSKVVKEKNERARGRFFSSKEWKERVVGEETLEKSAKELRGKLENENTRFAGKDLLGGKEKIVEGGERKPEASRSLKDLDGLKFSEKSDERVSENESQKTIQRVVKGGYEKPSSENNGQILSEDTRTLKTGRLASLEEKVQIDGEKYSDSNLEAGKNEGKLRENLVNARFVGKELSGEKEGIVSDGERTLRSSKDVPVLKLSEKIDERVIENESQKTIQRVVKGYEKPSLKNNGQILSGDIGRPKTGRFTPPNGKKAQAPEDFKDLKSAESGKKPEGFVEYSELRKSREIPSKFARTVEIRIEKPIEMNRRKLSKEQILKSHQLGKEVEISTDSSKDRRTEGAEKKPAETRVQTGVSEKLSKDKAQSSELQKEIPAEKIGFKGKKNFRGKPISKKANLVSVSNGEISMGTKRIVPQEESEKTVHLEIQEGKKLQSSADQNQFGKIESKGIPRNAVKSHGKAEASKDGKISKAVRAPQDSEKIEEIPQSAVFPRKTEPEEKIVVEDELKTQTRFAPRKTSSAGKRAGKRSSEKRVPRSEKSTVKKESDQAEPIRESDKAKVDTFQETGRSLELPEGAEILSEIRVNLHNSDLQTSVSSKINAEKNAEKKIGMNSLQSPPRFSVNDSRPLQDLENVRETVESFKSQLSKEIPEVRRKLGVRKIEVFIKEKIERVYERRNDSEIKEVFRKVEEFRRLMEGSKVFSQKAERSEKPIEVPKVRIEEIIERIQRIVESRREVPRFVERARVDLIPPDLGKMEIEIEKEGTNLRVLFKVTTEEAKEILEKRVPDLVHRLSSDGFGVEKVEVRLEREEREEDAYEREEEKEGQRENHQNEKRRKRREGEER